MLQYTFVHIQGIGLKSIEKQFGLVRRPEIQGMNGYDAVMLWKAYQWGDQDSLDRLIMYNTADIVNLKPLMEMGYDQMKKRVLPMNPVS
ncbi:MAG: ribonuclease H-like domain-containing protein [Pseudomonadota bacterium]